MGRIRHTTLAFGLLDSGYWLRATAFDAVGKIDQIELDRMSWRELSDVLEVMIDDWRPGVEILDGGRQDSLFR